MPSNKPKSDLSDDTLLIEYDASNPDSNTIASMGVVNESTSILTLRSGVHTESSLRSDTGLKILDVINDSNAEGTFSSNNIQISHDGSYISGIVEGSSEFTLHDDSSDATHTLNSDGLILSNSSSTSPYIKIFKNTSTGWSISINSSGDLVFDKVTS